MEEITKELNEMRDCERRIMEKEERKISRLEKESEAYREQVRGEGGGRDGGWRMRRGGGRSEK